MSDDFTLYNHEQEKGTDFPTLPEAKEQRQNAIELGKTPEQLEIFPPGESPPGESDESEEAKADGGTETVEPDVVDNTTNAVEPEKTVENDEPATVTTETEPSNTEELTPQDLEAIDELGESLDTDPLSILPGHMKDTIQGQPAVNKRGYAMIAERYNIEVSATIEHYPWENDEGRCVAHATAVTEDGKEYSGWGTACVDDGDMDDQIIELAETRSLKRALSWASGVGIVSYVEMTNQLEEKYQ